nr:ferric reductase-like transmembrane domain-containing protein [Mesobacterium pallidum]
MAWGAIAALLAWPLVAAAGSPYLQYRDPVYVAASFAGIAGLSLLVLQPLLAAGLLPALAGRTGRRLHRWTGVALLLAVAVHVAGLWITSPPDMVDALTFTAPTAFSAFGVVAMGALVAAAVLAARRTALGLRPRTWRLAHTGAALVVAAASVSHAALIEGTMGPLSKIAACTAVAGALAVAIRRLRPWAGPARARRDRGAA